MSNKTTGMIIAAVTGAAAGTMIALVSNSKKSASIIKSNPLSKTASNILDTAGTVMLNMSDMLR